MATADPKLVELLSRLRECHSDVVRSDRTLQHAMRVAEEANRAFANVLGRLERYVTMPDKGVEPDG